jgi:hypothetical protein
VTTEKSGRHPTVGNDRTGVQLPPLVLPNWNPPVLDYHFSTSILTCTPTTTYMALFFQANFELHPYDVEK